MRNAALALPQLPVCWVVGEKFGKDGKVDIAGDKLHPIERFHQNRKGYVIDRYICLRLRSEQEFTST